MTVVMADTLKTVEKKEYESKVIWHPYPKEKPNVPLRIKSEWGWEYSVAYVFLTTQKTDNQPAIGVSLFYDGEFQDNDVIAWADVEPYKEVEEDGNKRNQETDCH